MLHIFWMLIKFIFILLGILLGLAVLLVLLVLFCPVRYQAAASKEPFSFKDAKAYARISWLFGGVSFKLWYENGETGRDVRLFGLPLLKLISGKKSGKEKLGQKTTADKTTEPEKEPDIKPEVESAPPLENNKPGESVQKPHKPFSQKSPEPSERQKDTETVSPKESIFTRVGNKIHALREKLKVITEKIRMLPSKINKLKLTINQIYAKIEWWKNFFTHPQIQAALKLIKNKLFRLLRHIFPTKIEGQITFCCTDPSVTGTVLAVAGATMPLHKNCIRICPAYDDENMLKGDLKLRGRIYGVVLVKTALQVILNKDIKESIKKWKKHKED